MWVKDYEDRRQEIVFIGLKNQMNNDLIKNKLDNILVKNYSITEKRKLKFKDPFPRWF